MLGEPEQRARSRAHASPVPAPPAAGGRPRRSAGGRGSVSTLVGRDWEMSTIDGDARPVDRTGKGRIVGLVGPPGIGKSRMAGEIAALAAEPVLSRCSRHTANRTPAGSRSTRSRGLLRDIFGDRPASTTTPRGRAFGRRLPAADAEDLTLLDDLLGIRDGDTPLPAIDPDARGRRLTALLNAAAVARSDTRRLRDRGRALDRRGQRGDARPVRRRGSADALARCCVTYRPEYRGALDKLPSCAPHCACAAG